MKCSKCKSQNNQILRYHDKDGRVWYFDVDKALAIVKERKLKSKRITKNILLKLISRQHINPVDEHLKHVDNKPIILGITEKDAFCLDGNHRTLKHFLAKKLPMAYILSEFDTGRCVSIPPKGKVYVSR